MRFFLQSGNNFILKNHCCNLILCDRILGRDCDTLMREVEREVVVCRYKVWKD